MWVFNAWLWLVFLFAPEQYSAMVAAGAPCNTYVAALADPAFPQDANSQPGCWYDPANVNSGR